MVVACDQYKTFDDRFGHIFYEKPYSYYRLRVTYRFTGEEVPGGADWAWRNSGAILHCQSPQSMGKDQDFPSAWRGSFWAPGREKTAIRLPADISPCKVKATP